MTNSPEVKVEVGTQRSPELLIPDSFFRNLTAKLDWQDPEELPVAQIVEPPDSVQQHGLGRRLMGQGG